LDTGVPIFGNFALVVALLEVEGGEIHIVSVRKKEDAPWVTAALENRAMFTSSEGPPISNFPGVMSFRLGL